MKRFRVTCVYRTKDGQQERCQFSVIAHDQVDARNQAQGRIISQTSFRSAYHIAVMEIGDVEGA